MSRALALVEAEAGFAAGALRRVEIEPGESAMPGSPPLSDIAAGVYGALAGAAALIHERRGGARLTPFVSHRGAGLALAGNEYLTVNGEAPESWDPITGWYRAQDEWIYLHGNFPHLRDGLLALFGARNDRASMAARLAGWRADDAERAAQGRGLCAMRFRTATEWRAHPQHAALETQNLIQAAPRPAPPSPPRPAGAAPLSGFRALDLSRVIAGPMAGRALAELGADVLRVSGPHLPFIEPLIIDTGFSKRNAHVDLREESGRETLRALIRDADVLIDAYRPGALAARGFGAEALAKLNPGLIHVALSAFSAAGPWGGRRGYDSYVQAGAGFAEARRDGPPQRLACQPLDYLTGALAALAAMKGLLGRVDGEGGLSATLSLARTALWLREMEAALGPEPAPPARKPTIAEATEEGLRFFIGSEFGAIGALRSPHGFREEAPRLAPPRRLGADAPSWAQALCA